MKKLFKDLSITIVVSFIYYYIKLPAINPSNKSFWYFLAFILAVYFFQSLGKGKIKNFAHESSTNKGANPLEEIIKNLKFRKVKKSNLKNAILIGSIVSIFLMIAIVNLIASPLFMSKAYSQRIEIDKSSEFTKDVRSLESSALPIIDKSSSMRLGDRVMGQMADLVSQFSVSNLYTQINFQNQIIRVTPLEYNDFFKFISNRKTGIMGYITVNSVSGESKLVRLESGMKYMDSAILSKDLNRKLRFKYPTKNFGEKTFEIDEDGNPFWIVPTLSYAGIGIRAKVNGVIILNPVDGKAKFYKVEDVPTWVDHVYPADLIIEKVDHWGKFSDGFFNSIFSQKNVVKTTRGYNYTVFNNDVYLYTGITSATGDESILGFIMTNLRTKKTNFYEAPGAEEYSAMASAKGQVQQMNYIPTFPLLVNLNNKPTYFISLKDNAGLVKMYSFVDVVDYQKVVVTDASDGIAKAISNYLGDSVIIDQTTLIETEIIIKKITSATLDNSTVYYILDSNNNKYKALLRINEELLPFLSPTQKVKVKYLKKTGLTDLNSIE
ncbi:MAG: hypothetical protein JXR63_12305 [Spirochaetales bacterium]|nr:hypothetical protein [Spirochaetales bacterium]